MAAGGKNEKEREKANENQEKGENCFINAPPFPAPP